MKNKLILTVLISLFMVTVQSAYGQKDHNLDTRYSQNTGQQSETRSYNNSAFIKAETIYLSEATDIEINKGFDIPYQPDAWVVPDVRVDSGLVATAGFRQAVIRFGSDFSMYAVVNKKSVSGQFAGRINIYRSDNGGLNWMQISSIQSFSSYIGQFSVLTMNSTPGNQDSTRIILFYTLSQNQNLNSSVLNYYSVRRDGSAPLSGNILVATSGFKLFNPSAFSNFAVGGNGIGVIAGEYNNTTDETRSLRYLRSTDFGQTFQSVALIDPGYPTFNDYFPSASFKKGSTDSVYIAVERRLTSDTLVRIISTPWEPTASATTNFLTSGPDNYEKPTLSILQMNPAEKIMVTSVKNLGLPVYHYSNDGGASWIIDAMAGVPHQVDIKYIDCSSDPDTADGGYFIIGMQDALFSTSDSVSVRRGRLGDLGPITFKVNDVSSTGFLGPSVTIYKYTPMGGSLQKRSAVMYVGNGTLNSYYDQENLPVGISNNNSNVDNYKLSQNYPNPFNPTTKIDFSILKSSNVKLIVYDMLGRQVTTLVNKFFTSGSYTVDFDGANLTSGVYFYRIDVDNNFSDIKKMILVK